MMLPKIKIKNNLKAFLVILFIYIALFEFILPLNDILPRPSLLYESLISVWIDYDLLYELSYTTLMIYSPIILLSFFLFLFRGIIIKFVDTFMSGIDSIRFFVYLPVFFYVLLFVYWFETSILGELLFSLLLVLFHSLAVIGESLKNINKNHILVAKNLDVPASRIYAEIIWKSILPDLIKSLEKFHFKLWLLILFYEYALNFAGLGHAFHLMLNYNDYSGLISVAIYSSLLIFLGSYLISLSKSKIVFWD